MIGILALAFSAIMVKEANFEPFTNAFLWCLIAFITLVPFAFWEIKRKGKLNKNGVLLAILAGVFLGIDMTAWNYAIFFVGTGISSVLLNLQIIVMPLLAMSFDKFKPKKSFWVLVPIMIFGVILTGGIFDGDPAEGPTMIWGQPIALVGTLLGVLSGICYGVYLYTSRKSGTLNPGVYIQPLMWVFLAQLIPQAFTMIFISPDGWNVTQGILVNGKLPMNPEVLSGDMITIANWWWMIALAIIGHSLAWVFVQIGSVNLDPTIVAGLLLLSPIITVLVAPFTSGEKISILQATGIVIVLVAVAYQNDIHTLLLERIRGVKTEIESNG
ncbi:DMT family transporter [Bizionia argentinensis JUB59]|uniref:DMT family transporter n=1 Tax=Bizionia argentinensis JUB59 TaxID=1046627 RepID=G2EGF6_9FLAO|nr:DMT family transporter [Bizionia argentinensis]EGV42522.2 DMT family transporter [Bizionia argentinensis JUB59]